MHRESMLLEQRVPAKPANGALQILPSASLTALYGVVRCAPTVQPSLPAPPPPNERPLAPRSNAVDRFLPQFVGNKSPKTSCNCGNAQTGCDAGVRASGGGQPCLW